jgi:redox-regulated HSP33 family molecular chaperone
MQVKLLVKVLKARKAQLALRVLQAQQVLRAQRALQVQQVPQVQMALMEMMVLTALMAQQQPFRLARLQLVLQAVMPLLLILEPAVLRSWISAFLRVLQEPMDQTVLQEQTVPMVQMELMVRLQQ